MEIPICPYCDETVRPGDVGEEYVVENKHLDREEWTYAHAACYEADREERAKQKATA